MSRPRDFTKKYQCRKCGEMLTSFEVFESGWPNRIRHWCKDHIPLRSRLRLWRQEQQGVWKAWVCVALAPLKAMRRAVNEPSVFEHRDGTSHQDGLAQLLAVKPPLPTVKVHMDGTVELIAMKPPTPLALPEWALSVEARQSP